MKGLEIRLKVSCNLTAEDWDLYTNGPLAHTAQDVANLLNSHFERMVNNGNDREWVRTNMLMTMDTYHDFGAADTEPRAVLEDLLDEVFGR